MASNANMSKDFFELVKSIGESKSKQEEDKIIAREMHVLKQKMAAREVSSRKMKELLIRMIYVEMLGHDASFGHIHAIKMSKSGTLAQRRVGYMCCSLCLHSEHELMLLLVGGLQTDLQSDNHLEVATALIVVSKLASRDTVPAIFPLVVKLLDHPQANVRKKAVMALQRFHNLDSNVIESIIDKIKRILCDKNPSVMGACLYLIGDLIDKNASRFKDLVPSFVSILKQITEHRLPREYDYHRLPAPWIQIKLLQILRQLGTADKNASEGMYEVLHEVMRRADIGISIGYATIYECVRTVTSIYPSSALLEEAAKCTSRFITSENHNLKYLGINALASIVQVDPRYAAEHQAVVIDCLEDIDDTLRRKTLDLLFRMTNPANVVVIVEKLHAFLKTSVDVYLRTELVSKIIQLAERYSPENSWYLQTMNEVFEVGGDLVRPEVVHNVLRMIAEGAANEDADGDEEHVGSYAVDVYVELLEKPNLPDVMLRVISWVLGEFGHHSDNYSPWEITQQLFDVLERPLPSENSDVRSWALSAVLKLSVHLSSNFDEVTEVVERYRTSVSSDLQQRAHEFLELMKNKQTLKAVLPIDAFTDEVDINANLPFLDDYVATAREHGARPYEEPDFESEEITTTAKTIKVTAYPKWDQTKLTMTPEFEEPAAPAGASYAAAMQSKGVAPPSKVESNLPAVDGPWGRPKVPAAPSQPPAAKDEDDYPRESLKAAYQIPDSSRSRNGSAYSGSDHGSAGHEADESPEIENTKKPSKREAMMSGLFAGMGGGAAAPAKAKRKGARGRAGSRRGGSRAPGSGRFSRRRKASTDSDQRSTSSAGSRRQQQAEDPDFVVEDLSSAPPARAKQSEPDDLIPLDIFGGGPSAAPSSSNGNGAPSAGADDLLDILGAGLSAPAQSNGGGGANNGASLDLFGAPADQKQQQQQAAPAAGPADLMDFGDLLSTSSSPAGSQPAASTNRFIKRGAAGVSVAMSNRLAQVPKSPVNDEVLISNQALQISSYKVLGPNQTLVALFFSNLDSRPLKQVKIGVVPSGMPQGATLHFDISAGEPKAKQTGQSSIVIPELGGHATSAQFFGVRCQTLASLAGGHVDGTVTYDGSQQPLRFRTQVGLEHMLRPLTLQTPQYANMWKQLPCEQKFTIPSSVRSTNECAQRYQQNNVHHVATSQQEVIGSARALFGTGMPNQMPSCLVHCKVTAGNGLETIVRSPDRGLTAAFANACQTRFR